MDNRLKKGLGRGLSSLLGDSDKKIETNKISIKDITRNHLRNGGRCFGQCLTAVGWVGGTLPELYEEDGEPYTEEDVRVTVYENLRDNLKYYMSDVAYG